MCFLGLIPRQFQSIISSMPVISLAVFYLVLFFVFGLVSSGMACLLRWAFSDLAVGHALIAGALLTGIASYTFWKIIAVLDEYPRIDLADDDDDPESNLVYYPSISLRGKRGKRKKKSSEKSLQR